MKLFFNLVTSHSSQTTPPQLTDATQAVVWSADYDPFGNAAVTVNTVTNNLRFPGQYYDAESGNHYNYFRDYNPSLGRYIQSDPIGLSGGVNTYGYVGANPVNAFDILGLCKCRFAAKDHEKEGYYFERHTWLPLPRTSSRFECLYICSADGDPMTSNPDRMLGYIHDESHFGFSSGGPSSAKSFICKNSVGEFIPHFDDFGRVALYGTEHYGDFDPRGSGIEGLEAWAKENCEDCEK